MLDCTLKFPYTQYMFTLTKASRETKSILKWLLIILVVLFTVFIIYKLAITVKEILYPTPPPKPTLLFGKISAPNFPQNSINDDIAISQLSPKDLSLISTISSWNNSSLNLGSSNPLPVISPTSTLEESLASPSSSSPF